MAINFPNSPTIGQIVTSGGASFLWDGTKWKTVTTNNALIHGHGQVRLDRTDANTVQIAPYNGNRLIVDGESRVIQTGYLTKGASGSIWFVYAYMNAGVVAYEQVSTGPTLHASGVMTKSGDPTRTLIGCYSVATDTNVVEDSPGRRMVLNWFNRILKPASIAISGSTAQSGTPASIGGTGYFIMWPFQGVKFDLSGYITTNGTDHVFTCVRINTNYGAEAGENVALGQFKTASGSFATEFMSNASAQSFNAGLRTTGTATATMVGAVYGILNV